MDKEATRYPIEISEEMKNQMENAGGKNPIDPVCTRDGEPYLAQWIYTDIWNDEIRRYDFDSESVLIKIYGQKSR